MWACLPGTPRAAAPQAVFANIFASAPSLQSSFKNQQLIAGKFISGAQGGLVDGMGNQHVVLRLTNMS